MFCIFPISSTQKQLWDASYLRENENKQGQEHLAENLPKWSNGNESWMVWHWKNSSWLGIKISPVSSMCSTVEDGLNLNVICIAFCIIFICWYHKYHLKSSNSWIISFDHEIYHEVSNCRAEIIELCQMIYIYSY